MLGSSTLIIKNVIPRTKRIISPHSMGTDINPTPIRINAQNIDIKHCEPRVERLGGPLRYVLTVVIVTTTIKQKIMNSIKGVSAGHSSRLYSFLADF